MRLAYAVRGRALRVRLARASQRECRYVKRPLRTCEDHVKSTFGSVGAAAVRAGEANLACWGLHPASRASTSGGAKFKLELADEQCSALLKALAGGSQVRSPVA